MRTSGKRAARGLTLLEIITVVAIIGILAALAVNGLGAMRPRADFSSATNDLAAVLAESQARAAAIGGDVLVVVFDKPSAPSSRGYFVYEDPDLNFALATLTFPPVAAAGDRVSSVTDFMGGQFGGRLEWNDSDPFPLKAPFSGNSSACSFCSAVSGVTYGALAFSADGSVRLLNAEGIAQSSSAGVISLKTADRLHTAAIAVSPLTGFAGVYRP